MGGQLQAPPEPSTDEVIEVLHETRQRTLALVAGLSPNDLERVHSTLMSPLVWDLGHIAAFEDLWLAHRYGARELLRDDLMDVYDAFETPRAGRGELPFLRSAAAREYMEAVRARTLAVLDERGPGDGRVAELVIRHEQQHCETMLQTLQLARLDGYRLPGVREGADSVREDAAGTGSQAGAGAGGSSSHGPSGLELVDLPAGEFTLGAPADGFAYDNERPRHLASLPEFKIGLGPITNATFLTFVEGGGYERREWWSDEGWAWKEQYDIHRPGAWTDGLDGEWRLGTLHPLLPDQPVVHVSWFEADAFARAHGARLPSESEWEKAATWDLERDRRLTQPWGEQPLLPGVHANVDHVSDGPLPVAQHRDGVSPSGCLGMIGDTWEWTASEFTGYPGFVAHPYPEYSEVFFDDGYRVLRGGSWATRARVITAAFRNWDFPQRRQIFAGFRIARDA